MNNQTYLIPFVIARMTLVFICLQNLNSLLLLEYATKKRPQDTLSGKASKINGKKVIINNEDSCLQLKGSETLNLEHWDKSISLVNIHLCHTAIGIKRIKNVRSSGIYEICQSDAMVYQYKRLKALGFLSSASASGECWRIYVTWKMA